MTHLQTLFEQYLGKDVILYTTDGSSDRMINCGSLPTLFTTVDFGAGKKVKLNYMEFYQDCTLEEALNEAQCTKPVKS